MYSADGAFVTGTFAGVIPVTQIDQSNFNLQKESIIQRLFNLYKEKIKTLYL